jgi:predicted phage baseplate assembly protein
LSFDELKLDDRNFQGLVDEARRRISERCPEWTEHNVSDPGITLIETFAWMTEQLIYRLNRVPIKLHLALLELLGIELATTSAAEADLVFRLAEATDGPVTIPARVTEVTAPGATDDSVVFRVIDDFTIPRARPTAFVLQRGSELSRVPVVDGTAQPTGPEEAAFSNPPLVGDALYLGFEKSLSSLLMRVALTGDRARGVGVDPHDPPLRWEASLGADWIAATVLEDTTAGFNEMDGAVELEMPTRTGPAPLAGLNLHWLRCRVTELTSSGAPSPRYTDPPRLESVTARPVGAKVRAEQAMTVEDEPLGESDGSPGRSYHLRNAPAMHLAEGETLEVLDVETGEWEQWERVESFDTSDADDPHFRFDAAAGEVKLGPAIRTRGRGWQQLGAIPKKGSRLRITRYRHGGGASGTVDAGLLRQLRNPIPGIASVTNPRAATGGVDAEPLDAARLRAGLELRTRYRAVTPEDFAFLAREVSGEVARATCFEPAHGHAVPVYVLPSVAAPERVMTAEELTPDTDLLDQVRRYLNVRRMAGTSVVVMPALLQAVTVVADVSVRTSADERDVAPAIKVELERFINPLVGGGPPGVKSDGWGFGRTLNLGELYSRVQEVSGVERVRGVRMYRTDPRTLDKPEPRPAAEQITIKRNEVLCSAHHRVRAGDFRAP